MDFGNRLFELRKSRAMSQEELAERLGVTRQTVSKWEVGDSTPDMEKLIALGEIFEITLDELVLGRVPAGNKLDKMGGRIMTESNKRKFKKGAKFAGLAAAVILAVDVVSMVVYFLMFGMPK